MRWTIRKKLFAGFGLVIMALLLASAFSAYQLMSVANRYETVLEDRVPKIVAADKLALAVANQGRSLRGFMLENDEQLVDQFQEHKDVRDEQLKQLSETLTSKEMVSLLDELYSHVVTYDNSSVDIMDLTRNGDAEGALKIYKETLLPVNEQIQQDVDTLVAFQGEGLKKTSDAAKAQADQARNLLLLISGLATVVGLVTAAVIGRMIGRPLQRLARSARQVAEGDLSGEELSVNSKDEVQEVVLAFNQMKGSLVHLIQNVHASAETVTAYSEQLYASTEEVAATTQDVSSLFESMSKGAQATSNYATESQSAIGSTAEGLQEIADKNQAIDQGTTENLGRAQEGVKSIAEAEGQMMAIKKATDETAKTIEKLNRQSSEIERITKAITGITEQTNLLALNAAIEAARAGEHGKGFAVVAEEVKKLAEESKRSAQEINRLIREIQHDTSEVAESFDINAGLINDGVTLIQTAGSSFRTIVETIEESSHKRTELASASDQASANSQEIAAAITEMARHANETTEHTLHVQESVEEQLAMMQEINGIAETMSEMSQELQRAIQGFKL